MGKHDRACYEIDVRMASQKQKPPQSFDKSMVLVIFVE